LNSCSLLLIGNVKSAAIIFPSLSVQTPFGLIVISGELLFKRLIKFVDIKVSHNSTPVVFSPAYIGGEILIETVVLASWQKSKKSKLGRIRSNGLQMRSVSVAGLFIVAQTPNSNS